MEPRCREHRADADVGHSLSDRDGTRSDHRAVRPHLDENGCVALAAHADGRDERRAGRDAIRQIQSIDPCVAEYPRCERFDGHRDTCARETHHGRIGVSCRRPSVGEQDDARDVARRELCSSRRQRCFEIRALPVDCACGGRRGVHAGQLAQRGGVRQRGHGRPERDDPRLGWTDRALDVVNPRGGRFDGRARHAVRHVDCVHDGLAGRLGSDDRPRERDRQHAEKQRARRGLDPSLAWSEIVPRHEHGKPHERHRQQQPERRRGGPGDNHLSSRSRTASYGDPPLPRPPFHQDHSEGARDAVHPPRPSREDCLHT